MGGFSCKDAPDDALRWGRGKLSRPSSELGSCPVLLAGDGAGQTLNADHESPRAVPRVAREGSSC